MEGLAKVPKLYQPGPDAQTSALIFPRLKVDPFRKLPWQSDESWASRDSDAAVLTNNNMHRGSTSLWHLWHPELKGKSCTDSGSRLPVIQGCSKRMDHNWSIIATWPQLMILVLRWKCSMMPKFIYVHFLNPEWALRGFKQVNTRVHVHSDTLQTIFSHGINSLIIKKNKQNFQ